jgi:hypothetical protein
MTKRIGLVQTGGVGDIIIALPIADHFEELGYEVVWPVLAEHCPTFQPAKPSIRFIPVERSPTSVVQDPVRIIREQGCERTIILYSWVRDMNVYDPRLSRALKFDEYKYAIAGVPFSKKWDLKYDRNVQREERLFDSLGIIGEYVCFHGQSSEMTEPFKLPPRLAEGLQVIEMTKRTGDEVPLDWLLTLERAAKLILVDSCFANLVEQMNLPNRKVIIAHHVVSLTPVFKNGWQFLFPDAFGETDEPDR